MSQRNQDATGRNGIDRRSYLAALSATAAAGLAGCGGGDGESDGGSEGTADGGSDGSADGGSDGGSDGGRQELGERVGSMNMVAMSGLPNAGAMEQSSGYVGDLLTEEFGVDTSVEVKDAGTFFADLFNNARTQNFHVNLNPPFLRFLDPHPVMVPYVATAAGADGGSNDTQYASCDYSNAVMEQVGIGDPEERQQKVNEALSIASEDVMQISLLSGVSLSAWRTDQVEFPDAGVVGINDRNIPAMHNWTPVGDNEDLIIGQTPGNIDAVEFWQSVYSIGWTQNVYSGLTYYDENQEIQAGLATDWERNEDATQYTFTLREGATFHDGTPITSEDVKWTYEWLQENNAQIPDVNSWPYDTIETPDDQTVVVNMSESNAAWFNAHVPLWGIFKKEQFVEAGAEENPLDLDLEPEEVAGSGPYQIASFSPEELLDLEPYEDHWIDVPGNLVFQGFADFNAMRRALIDGSINLMINASVSAIDQIQQQIPDVSEVSEQPSFNDWFVSPAMDYGPTKFREFRLALSQAIDRQFIGELFYQGRGATPTYSAVIGENHPWFPENPDEVLTQIAPSATGDIETAKQTLSDAGWGWDDQGRLHYPPDADLEPLWPQGEEPANYPERWPCVEDLE